MKTQEILNNVNEKIETIERIKRDYGWTKTFAIREVCDELNIFDWWKETLSLTQLKQMKKFLETAIKLGYTGHASFKVGAKYCSHGMWAYKEESTNGYDPTSGGCIYHSFRNGDNYWDAKNDSGEWLFEVKNDDGFTLAEVKEFIGK